MNDYNAKTKKINKKNEAAIITKNQMQEFLRFSYSDNTPNNYYFNAPPKIKKYPDLIPCSLSTKIIFFAVIVLGEIRLHKWGFDFSCKC